MNKLLIPLLAVLLLGCSTLYTNIVTITKIRYSAMTELAALKKAGKISPETDAKIAKADLAYRQAAEVAEKALVAYKAGGSSADYTAALQAVKVAVTGVLDILTPFIEPAEAAEYQDQLVKSNKL